MNAPTDSEDAVVAQLCPACGLCCNGVIFANVQLQKDLEAERLGLLGLPVSTPQSALRPPHLSQPCAAFDGCRCRVYADRPQYCHQFECVLLKSVKAGRTEPPAALRIIRTARERAEKVRRLLRGLGDTAEQVALSARFRHTGKRLKAQELDEETAETYAQLTLAVHDLNLLLGDAFYPGSPRQGSKPGTLRTALVVAGAALAFFAASFRLQADQVELQNGDRYVGQVVSVNTNTVILQSDVLGTLRLPRDKVAVITLGPGAGGSSPALPSPLIVPRPAVSTAPTNAAVNLPPSLRGLGANTNLIQQVQKQFLAGAGDEANNKFNELLGGLMSGKLSIEDIRAQAKTAADQLHALQRESGEDAGFAASAYLSILDHFLQETAPTPSTTNTPARAPTAKAAPALPGE